MKDIKTYKKVSNSERGSKDLVFYSEGWENSNVYGFAFFFFLSLGMFFYLLHGTSSNEVTRILQVIFWDG